MSPIILTKLYYFFCRYYDPKCNFNYFSTRAYIKALTFIVHIFNVVEYKTVGQICSLKRKEKVPLTNADRKFSGTR